MSDRWNQPTPPEVEPEAAPVDPEVQLSAGSIHARASSRRNRVKHGQTVIGPIATLAPLGNR
jgi:hypothetical protein